jgi:hypothetical protein
MSRSLPVMEQRKFGETLRRDTWWIPNVIVVAILSSFLAYVTWAAFQNANYTYGPYLSPLYSPELLGASPHAWFGPMPAWWPAWLPFSPALIILPVPAIFRFTCYYYRGSYYKAFWADPPACSVGEPRKSYLGENSFPLIMQNVHRYGLLLAFIFLVFLWHDLWLALWFDDGSGGTTFGIGVGTIVMLVNVILLTGLHDRLSLHATCGWWRTRSPLEDDSRSQARLRLLERVQPRSHEMGVAEPVLRRTDRRVHPALRERRDLRHEDHLMAEYERVEHDVLVIGAGGAGLRAAIAAAATGAKVGLVCKSLLGKAHTVMAEGGVAARWPTWTIATVGACTSPTPCAAGST